jgi:hypothetical protein
MSFENEYSAMLAWVRDSGRKLKRPAGPQEGGWSINGHWFGTNREAAAYLRGLADASGCTLDDVPDME